MSCCEVWLSLFVGVSMFPSITNIRHIFHFHTELIKKQEDEQLRDPHLNTKTLLQTPFKLQQEQRDHTQEQQVIAAVIITEVRVKKLLTLDGIKIADQCS